MAVNIPSGFIEICDYSIGKVEDRLSTAGKNLKAAFRLGPSPVIKSNGKVEVGSEAPGQEQEVEQNNTSNDSSTSNSTNNTNNTNSNNSNTNTNSTTSNNSNSQSNSDNNSHESYTYSMLEAYLHSRLKFEADDAPASNEQPTNNSPSNNDSSSNSSQDSSNSNSQDSEQNNSEEPIFESGSDLYVRVLLPNEGCTIWHLVLDKKADVNKVTSAVKAGSFKSACEIARKGLKTDGLVVMSAKTYISKKAKVGCPFFGNCNYAFDSASDKDNNNDTNAICLAVAPFDARTGKPSQETVYKITYSILKDISKGEIDKIKNGKSTNGSDEDSKASDEDSDAISKWISSKFKNVGDKTMYSNFNKIRDFIAAQISSKNIEIDSDDTETATSYSKVAEVKKGLITY